MSDVAFTSTPRHAPALPLDASPRLRLWPALLLAVVQWPMIVLPIWLMPGSLTQILFMFWGPMVVAGLFAAWWLLASRAPWLDRALALGFAAAAGAAATFLVHPSFKIGLLLYGLPLVTTAWALWLAASSGLPWGVRRAGLLLAIAAGWGACAAGRFNGAYGDIEPELAFRWSATGEERFLAGHGGPAAAQAAEKVALEPGDWPGFRGADRDGRRAGFRLDADWSTPPKELWRHRVGPGWSSFAIVGDRAYTQEQRGDDEAVVCYHAGTGKERWVHTDAARFTEVVAGPGPRATPTFHGGKVYALGAKGRLNCLDAATGKVAWSRDVAEESGAKVPTWGFSASPLVAEGLVSVFAGGPGGKAVLAYDAETGKPAWQGGNGLNSYCSTQLVTLGGAEQMLVASGEELESLDPKTGKVLWSYAWPMSKGMARCTQPAVVGADGVLLGTGFGAGTRRLKVTRKGDAWSAEEVWETKAINPYYNDFVVYKDDLYGFDGIFFTCVSLEDGKSRWRQRGYGNGQVLLLAEQGLLLVLAEKGQVALLEASPEGHKLLGKFAALEGKTWNHPVVAGGRLFVRNGEWAACYALKAK